MTQDEWVKWRIGTAFLELVFQRPALADETADRINDMMLLIGAALDKADADKIADATGYDFHEGRP